MTSAYDLLFFREDENIFSTNNRQVALIDIVSIPIVIKSFSAEWNVYVSIWYL